MVVCYLVLSFYLVWCGVRGSVAGRSVLKRVCCRYGVVVVAAVPFLLLHVYVTWCHFGTLLVGSHAIMKVEYIPRGLVGLLVSPGKGVFLYNPMLVLAVGGFVVFWRRERAWAAFVLAGFLGCLLLHGSAACYHGNWCWGPRYLCRYWGLLFLPVMFLGLGEGRLLRVRVGAFVVLAVVGVLVQVAAVSMHHGRELAEMDYHYRESGGWNARRWTMFEPEARFLQLRVCNLWDAVDDMVHGRIAPWPVVGGADVSAGEELGHPAMHYLAFWPYHLTYWPGAAVEGRSVPLWGATAILVGGLAVGVVVVLLGYRRCGRGRGR